MRRLTVVGLSLLIVLLSTSFVYAAEGVKYDFAEEDESVRYLIKAISTGMTDDGVKTYIESEYEIEYPLRR